LETYRSNGKLLLTGEYVVLDGALSLALPTKLGQRLTVEKNKTSQLKWTSIDHDGSIWFESEIDIATILSQEPLKTDNAILKRLIQILRAVLSQNLNALEPHQGLSITTTLEFNRSWGLGSSSTLINNIATWANIDAFQLLKDTFGGSGYDIACAQNDTSILYQRNNSKPSIEPVDFHPKFSDQLYFVYLNAKQDSRQGIAKYRALNKANKTVIEQITGITQDMLVCDSLDAFEALLTAHEVIISELIGQPPIKQQLFPDYNGAIKSLGAWGGDFILVSGINNPKDYFSNKGYKTIFEYSDLIL
jgi:mevalonate kinase